MCRAMCDLKKVRSATHDNSAIRVCLSRKPNEKQQTSSTCCWVITQRSKKALSYGLYSFWIHLYKIENHFYLYMPSVIRLKR